jgi:hypothetical protein
LDAGRQWRGFGQREMHAPSLGSGWAGARASGSHLGESIAFAILSGFRVGQSAGEHAATVSKAEIDCEEVERRKTSYLHTWADLTMQESMMSCIKFMKRLCRSNTTSIERGETEGGLVNIKEGQAGPYKGGSQGSSSISFLSLGGEYSPFR